MGPTFVHGDRPSRPARSQTNRLLCIIRDNYSLQGLLTTGVCIQALSTYLLANPYAYIPGALLLLATLLPHVLNKVGITKKTEECVVIPGKTTAFLDFANPVHVGKPPGAPALTHEKQPVQLALMLIGSRCATALGALEPTFMEMGQTIDTMVEELRAADAEVGFLNAESYIPATLSSANGPVYCFYWKSYEHIMRWTHQTGGRHYPAWEKFRRLQREQATLASKIGIWHEIYEVSNAEGIYQNMPRMGLGDLWGSVKTDDGRIVYRNSLVSGTGKHASSRGRMGHDEHQRAPGVAPGATYNEFEEKC